MKKNRELSESVAATLRKQLLDDDATLYELTSRAEVVAWLREKEDYQDDDVTELALKTIDWKIVAENLGIADLVARSRAMGEEDDDDA